MEDGPLAAKRPTPSKVNKAERKLKGKKETKRGYCGGCHIWIFFQFLLLSWYHEPLGW
jgi:hypothetical protein